jgi:glycosyltransferase involved in cell wall biosynthesis
MFGISIIVVSYNSEKLIEETLSNLFKQENVSQLNWEILLVNNNSTDNTLAISNALHAQYYNVDFRIVHEQKPGTAYARFKGVAEAKYDVICFIDDDNRVPADWASIIYEIMKDSKIDILACAGTGDLEKEPPDWFENNKEAYAIGSLYTGENIINVTHDANLPTAGMCIRKVIFENLKLQNWQPLLTGRIGKSQAPGEDSELCQAARLLGYKMFYTNALTFKHFMPENRINWQKFLDMTYGFGVTDVFILPYKLTYDFRKNDKYITYLFRKIWWINYLGKKITKLLIYLKYISGKIDHQNYSKFVVRNNAFCNTIIAEKAKFKNSFLLLNSLRNIK